MVEDDLGEIKDFNVGHQSLEEIDPDLSLSAMLLWKDAFESRISDVTLFLILRNLPKVWWVCLFGFKEYSFPPSNVSFNCCSDPWRIWRSNCRNSVRNTLLSWPISKINTRGGQWWWLTCWSSVCPVTLYSNWNLYQHVVFSLLFRIY